MSELNKKTSEPGGLLKWIDDRYPLIETWNAHVAEYYAPKNFNFWYFFGSFALLTLVIMIVSGIWLAMSYKPSADEAFNSLEYIMRDVQWGWLIRYIHTTGASAFFIVVYLHMMRALLYGSYKQPRELVWLIGMLIFVVLMAEAFMGYMLPWGQMSYWGAQVIISLFSTIPFIGPDLALWIRGDYIISDATLNRFFALHVIALPLVLVVLVFMHIVALHKVGSNNPDGTDIKKHKSPEGIPLDGVPFHPYYTVKDSFGAVAFLLFFAIIVFYFPDGGGHFIEPPNFEPADPLKTPDHIAPVWYFTPFYAILRAVPDPFLGVAAMGLSIAVLFAMPWLDRCKVRSIRYRGTSYKLLLTMLVISFIVLGVLGALPSTPLYTKLAQIFTILYFAFFFVLPFTSANEKTKPVPERTT
ncbi:cytochrome bc complex cytochrome b subunit [Thiomicrospira microaerophila]|uniref:cytochrome b n=1 Tax=Thiomicrospira microaerophila TaxID=406020 RepID=UPI002010AA20|nr:cytochrome bc complex cytochrome b subunit [Thiomicrospira microaerophila]UQB42938.1 cytochrome bc complex cytochrome b subunit [Thiomicrospira microaerophila]